MTTRVEKSGPALLDTIRTPGLRSQLWSKWFPRCSVCSVWFMLQGVLIRSWTAPMGQSEEHSTEH